MLIFVRLVTCLLSSKVLSDFITRITLCRILKLYDLPLLNLLKTAGHVMHQQFNIQQLYALPTLHLCVLYLSENKQRLVPLHHKLIGFL